MADQSSIAAFDAAVAAELPRVSHVEYDSHEICKHFAGKVRERIVAASSAPSLSVLTIKALGLDVITAYVNDIAPGHGELTVTCYGLAWTCYWGAMGEDRTVRQFVAGTSPAYVANCLIRGRNQFPAAVRNQGRELAYLTRIAAAVIAECKAVTT